MRRPSNRWLVAGGIVALALLLLIPIGRWEGSRHTDEQLDGIQSVLDAIGPFDQPRLDAYRRVVGNPGLDCVLYRRGTNRFALEFCFDGDGRVIEGYDRRGSSPKIWSLREHPSASTIYVDRPQLEALIDRLIRSS